VLEQQAADDRADGHAEADRAGPHADGAAALARVEDVGDDRQGRGHDRRGAEAHEGTGPDELVRGAGVGRDERGDAEQRETDGQRDAAAEAVGQDAGGEEQAGEDEGV